MSKAMRKRQESQLKYNNQDHDWMMTTTEWLSDDDSDGFYEPKKPKRNRNRRKAAKQTLTLSSKPSTSDDIIREKLNNHRLPSRICKIFSNLKCERDMMKVLKGIQDEEDRYWQSTDKQICSRQEIIEHFQLVKYADFEQENGKQILNYLQNPILQKRQYGILLFNFEKQIFVVQNHDGTWNAPKSYRKIDENYQLETIIETASRGFNEQIRARNQLTDEIECYDQQLDLHKYIEHEFIGLFISEFDTPIIEFELINTRENRQMCQWISIDDIINPTSSEHFDAYHTLRPFAQHIFDFHFQQRPMENEIKTFENNLDNTTKVEASNFNRIILTPLSIRDEIFDSAQSTIEFDNDRNQMLNESFVANYVPQIIDAFNLSSKLPKDHMNIAEYRKCIMQRLHVPYYKKPYANSMFPIEKVRQIYRQPKKISILPLLIVAQQKRVHLQTYDIISERNSLRKIAMNNENYVIGVARVGQTLFLRRHDNRFVNKNDVGSRFEQMCRPDYHLDAEFKLLIESCIGNLKILFTAETDVIHKDTNQPMELKSRLNTIEINQPNDRWLQAFLSGAKTIIVGHRTADEPPLLVDIHEYDTSSIASMKKKEDILCFLYRVLCFLRENVQQDGIYLLSRRYDSKIGKRDLYLYKVADKHEQELTFVTTDLLEQLNFNFRYKK